MLNGIWLGLLTVAALLAGITGRLGGMTDGAIQGANTAVTVSLGLIGVMALIFFSVTESYSEKKVGYMTWILVLLSLTTLLVNGIALSAIAFRISEWGITPNRLAVLGVNLVMLVHLVMVSRQLIRTVLGKSKLEEVGFTLVRYLPIYLLWTAIVTFLFPVLFGFK